MRISHVFSLALVAGLVVSGLFAGNALSGQPRPNTPAAAPATGGGGAGVVVAAIDLGKVLKDHRGFIANMEKLKVEVQAAEAALNTQRQTIQGKEEGMKNFKVGSPDFKQAEEILLREKTKFNLDASLQKKDLMERETQVYSQTYSEISKEVKSFAEYYKVHLVLRYSSDPTPDEKGALPGADRSDVARNLSKPIIYLRQDLDITNQILSSINTRYPEPPKTANKESIPPVRNK